MLLEYNVLGMGWWITISSLALLGVIAITVWAFARWAAHFSQHPASSTPVAPSAAEILRQRSAYEKVDTAPEPRRVHVTLLTAPQCGYSEEAKVTLLRLAREYPLDVEMVQLRSPAGDRLALQGGVLFPPGLFLDGEPFSYGSVSEETLRQELARRSTVAAYDLNEATDRRPSMTSSRR